MRETRGGIFANTKVSWVRDYKHGGPAKIEALPVVHLDPYKKYQEILGFGASFTDAACYMISQLDKDIGAKLLEDIFSPSGMGLNVGRTTVAQCDFGRVCYSYNDTPDDIQMKNFTIDYDREYIIPTIRKAREINPGLFLLSSPWSPPGWMKTGGLMTGGWMRAAYLEAFANYYLCYLREYAKAGIKINALTPQNETETDQLSLMPACYWHPEIEMSFVRDHMVPLLRKNGMDVEVWIMDHNYNMWRRAKWMLEDPGLKAVVKGVAFHPYEGPAEVMTQLHDIYPEIDMHMTEIGGRRIRSSEGICNVGKTFTDMMRNWSRSIFCWNLALDETGRPNIGPFFIGGGMVEIHSETHEISYNAQYWALAHFSKFIKRGARRIESECNFQNFYQVAFINPDGEYVVIITNPGPETEVSLDLKERYATVPIPECSMSTIVFR
jgi:glucosylceramidase